MNILVRRMLGVIESQYAEVITLQTLAQRVERQPAYVGRLFRQEVGVTVRDFLAGVRVDHAARLLRNGVDAEGVAAAVGYRSRKNFYKQFKQRFGTTPTRYRVPSEPAAEGAAVAASPPTLPASEGDGNADNRGEPLARQLGTLVRATNEACDLAARMQQRLLSQFRASRIAMFVTDAGGRYAGANHAATSLTGYSSAELHSLYPTDVFADAPQYDPRCVWQLVLSADAQRDRSPNAMLHSKAGSVVRVHLVTLRNILWTHPDTARLFQ